MNITGTWLFRGFIQGMRYTTQLYRGITISHYKPKIKAPFLSNQYSAKEEIFSFRGLKCSVVVLPILCPQNLGNSREMWEKLPDWIIFWVYVVVHVYVWFFVCFGCCSVCSWKKMFLQITLGFHKELRIGVCIYHMNYMLQQKFWQICRRVNGYAIRTTVGFQHFCESKKIEILKTKHSYVGTGFHQSGGFKHFLFHPPVSTYIFHFWESIQNFTLFFSTFQLV